MFEFIVYVGVGFGLGYLTGFIRGYKRGRSDGLYNPTQVELIRLRDTLRNRK